jgi:hypothetical protein
LHSISSADSPDGPVFIGVTCVQAANRSAPIATIFRIIQTSASGKNPAEREGNLVMPGRDDTNGHQKIPGDFA